jgi:hypothetical protein
MCSLRSDSLPEPVQEDAEAGRTAGDRACLALGIGLSCPVVTTGRLAIGVEVVFAR